VRRSDTLARRLGVGIGVIGGFFLGYALVRLSGISHQGWVLISLTTMEGLILGYLGTPYLLGGWRDFNKRLTSTPLPDLLSGLLGMIVGLVIAVLIGVFRAVRRRPVVRAGDPSSPAWRLRRHHAPR